MSVAIGSHVESPFAFHKICRLRDLVCFVTRSVTVGGMRPHAYMGGRGNVSESHHSLFSANKHATQRESFWPRELTYQMKHRSRIRGEEKKTFISVSWSWRRKFSLDSIRALLTSSAEGILVTFPLLPACLHQMLPSCGGFAAVSLLVVRARARSKVGIAASICHRKRHCIEAALKTLEPCGILLEIMEDAKSHVYHTSRIRHGNFRMCG